MLDPKVEQALNAQMNVEIFSSHYYLAMAAYFHAENLNGFASYMLGQSQEEMKHAMTVYHYLINRGGRVVVEGLDKPGLEWESPLAALETALAHERANTQKINELVKTCTDAGDHATALSLQGLVSTQLEDEAEVQETVDKMHMLEGMPGRLYMMDRELATHAHAIEYQQSPANPQTE
jgi:ferritin